MAAGYQVRRPPLHKSAGRLQFSWLLVNQKTYVCH